MNIIPDVGHTFLCAKDPAVISKVIGKAEPKVEKHIRKKDRKWFAKHPHRTHRLRKPYPRECLGPYVIVGQLEPGVRRRHQFEIVNIDENIPLPKKVKAAYIQTLQHDDNALAVISHTYLNHTPQGDNARIVVPIAPIITQVQGGEYAN